MVFVVLVGECVACDSQCEFFGVVSDAVHELSADDVVVSAVMVTQCVCVSVQRLTDTVYLRIGDDTRRSVKVYGGGATPHHHYNHKTHIFLHVCACFVQKNVCGSGGGQGESLRSLQPQSQRVSDGAKTSRLSTLPPPPSRSGVFEVGVLGVVAGVEDFRCWKGQR